jgi:hypothetical protein
VNFDVFQVVVVDLVVVLLVWNVVVVELDVFQVVVVDLLVFQ